MHTDARTLEDGIEITGDLCIVGAGPAGISMALDWAGRSERVILLEGGGFELSPQMQALYENENSGREYYPLESARLHFFGGTSSHWGGLCAPFDPIDFEERPWVPLPGWPISRAEMDPYYRRAEKLCDLASSNWDPAYWSEQLVGSRLALDPEKLRTKIWQHSGRAGGPLRFGNEYRSKIEQADNIHLFTHANVCNLRATPDGSHVRALTVRHFNGDEQTVRAEHVALACGAIQNARLLLASNDQVATGLGNERDLVGRHFMEHIEVDVARLAMPEPRSLSLYQSFFEGQFEPAWGLVQPTARQQRSQKTLNGAVRFGTGEPNPDSFGTFDDWPEDAENSPFFRNRAERRSQYEGPDTSAADGGRRFPEHKNYRLNIRAEQRPHPESRVTLTDDTDALGVPRTDLHWTLSEQDKRSIRTIVETIGEEFARIGLGRVQLLEWLRADESSWPDFLTGGWHHMGTCRMATSPQNGVVDENCTVHGMDNLHVAGSAVYPTGGCANPTLTIAAISLRLSDHLKSEIR